MVRYQATLAYDGTNYSGFQRLNRRPSVQDSVETSLQKLGWTGKAILSAGRTDSGVHALGQVIAFDLDWPHPAEALQRALNAHLPADISIRSLQACAETFHPRFDALSRRYIYRLLCDPVRDPLRERYAWRVWPAPVGDRLAADAGRLIGVHDFAAFGTPPKRGGTTIRTVMVSSWRLQGPEWIFEIEANAFLYHMVRRLVRLQVEIGQGLKPADSLQKLLRDPGDGPPPAVAPAQGLFLAEVRYSEGSGD